MEAKQILQLLQANGLNLFRGLLVLAIGLFIAHWAIRLMRGASWFQRIEPTLRSFVDGLVKILLYVLVALTAANVLGIPLTSFLTLLASAGVAVSLAMQGALSNLVGGVTMLLLKPMKAGEYVKVGDIEGTVFSIGVFYTELITPDNRHISMPNSNLTGTSIINFTREGTRRLDVDFGVSYTADIDRARETLTEVVRRTDGILPDPAPQVLLAACQDSSLKFTIRVWCTCEQYWDVNYALIEGGKKALDAAGIEIPYPQMDVHLR